MFFLIRKKKMLHVWMIKSILYENESCKIIRKWHWSFYIHMICGLLRFERVPNLEIYIAHVNNECNSFVVITGEKKREMIVRLL